MDYTELPRQLIYKDRLWLEDFDIYNNGKNFNKPIVKVLKQRFSHDRDIEKYILCCMNNAYYICTMALMEKDPSLRVSKYCDLAGVIDGSENAHLQQPVLCLVFYYLCSLPKGVGHHLEEMLLELKERIFNDALIKDLPDVVLPSDEFAPRVIDDSAVRDAQIREYRWMTQTDYFKDEHLFKIVESLGNTPEEKQHVIKILIDAVQMSYSGNSWYKDERVKLLKGMMKEYGGVDEDEPATNQSNVNQPETDIAPLKKRIEELEEENERLKEKVKELEVSKQLLDTPLDAIEADSKVGLTEILKLMKNDGANFTKSKNKTIAAKALKMMTGRSDSACKQIFSVPLSPTYSGHKKKISELNGYLEALGMKTLL